MVWIDDDGDIGLGLVELTLAERMILGVGCVLMIVAAVAIFAPIFIATLHLGRWVCS